MTEPKTEDMTNEQFCALDEAACRLRDEPRNTLGMRSPPRPVANPDNAWVEKYAEWYRENWDSRG